MSDEDLPSPHYTLLPANTDLLEEAMRYDCSLCDKDVYNLSMHAQFEHNVRTFTVDHEETPRDYGTIGHLCGINGCTFDGNHEGRHSWQPDQSVEGDVTANAS